MNYLLVTDTTGETLQQPIRVEVVLLPYGVQINVCDDNGLKEGCVLERRAEGTAIRIHKDDHSDPQVILLTSC